MSNNIDFDFKYLKKHYGENFAKLCRTLFPTILQTPGLLTSLITSHFAPTKFLQEELTDKRVQQDFQIYIREKTYNNITCNDYDSFISAVKDGNLNNVNGLDIKLCMDFKRGNGDKLEEHENSFIIIFKPYEITFARKSNHNDSNMNKIEEQINIILKKFPVENSIFCNKDNK